MNDAGNAAKGVMLRSETEAQVDVLWASLVGGDLLGHDLRD